MLPFLTNECLFPSVETALIEPDGLLCAGADLSPNRLISAYSKGIFPWYSDGEPILWWSPNPRTIFDIANYNPSKSLCRFARKSEWKITLNNAFEEVIQACAEPRSDLDGTWITNDIIEAYNELHKKGYAHSIEIWQDSPLKKRRLIGGIYGVAIGKLFCGESMFSRESQASKIAISCLIRYLDGFDFPILDAQIKNPHLSTLGSKQIERESFIKIINNQIIRSNDETIWQPKELNMKELVTRIVIEK
ncbi:MAG: leucyl/phenylalanyl-tRNA--protein transferase [Kangiella sp.]|nr:MAG: leucyl/phenylalanyl-tRNA--protein transferase [Kangiella sp.]